MRYLLAIVAIAQLLACAAPQRSERPPADVGQKLLYVFPSGARIYWVPSQGDAADARQIARLTAAPNDSARSLARLLAPARVVRVQVAVAGPNSALARQVAVAALDLGEDPLPYLELLFIGHPSDEEAVRSAVTKKSGRFFFQPWP